MESSASKIVEEKPIEEPAKQQPEEQPAEQTASQPLNTPTDPALLETEKAAYLKRIAAHIDKHKFYPRAARRRHIEGKVNVSFDLLIDGRISNLHTYSGPQILQQATADSIHGALPFPERPESLHALNSITIEYAMQFALD